MNDALITQILTVLSTMKGYPNWPTSRPGDPLSAMDAAYSAGLSDIPDAIGKEIRGKVLLRYDERPSVKQIREWAASIAEASSSRGTLPDYLPSTAQMTGPLENPAGSIMGLLTDAARQTKEDGGAIPPAVREQIRWLREQTRKDGTAPVVGQEDRGNWGIEYVRPDGSVTRLPARYSESAARAKADEQARKYTHLRVRVWQSVAVTESARANEMRPNEMQPA